VLEETRIWSRDKCGSYRIVIFFLQKVFFFSSKLKLNSNVQKRDGTNLAGARR